MYISRVNSVRLSRFWSLTALTPHSFAARDVSLAFSTVPWWLWPISAMTYQSVSSLMRYPSIVNFLCICVNFSFQMLSNIRYSTPGSSALPEEHRPWATRDGTAPSERRHHRSSAVTPASDEVLRLENAVKRLADLRPEHSVLPFRFAKPRRFGSSTHIQDIVGVVLPKKLKQARDF